MLESTTYPGTTDELLLPMLTAKGMDVGKDFFLCFSPERVDPGNPKFQTSNIPKVVGGITPACTEIGALFYGQALEKVVPVSSTRVAEMVKLLENTFRMINIGLVNEMALMCVAYEYQRLGSDRRGRDQTFWVHAVLPGARVWEATAFQSIHSICPGRASKRGLRHGSLNLPGTSMARCRSSWSKRFRTR